MADPGRGFERDADPRPSRFHGPRDPCLEQANVGESRQAADPLVDSPRRRPPVRAGEQIVGKEARLLRRLHTAADGRPESVDEQARDARRGCASLCIGGGEGIALIVEK